MYFYVKIVPTPLHPTPYIVEGGGEVANYVNRVSIVFNSVSKLGSLSYFLSKLCTFGMDV